jgi:hypothetical protein
VTGADVVLGSMLTGSGAVVGAAAIVGLGFGLGWAACTRGAGRAVGGGWTAAPGTMNGMTSPSPRGGYVRNCQRDTDEGDEADRHQRDQHACEAQQPLAVAAVVDEDRCFACPGTLGLRGGGEDGAGHEDSHPVGGRVLRGRSLMGTPRKAYSYLVLPGR